MGTDRHRRERSARRAWCNDHVVLQNPRNVTVLREDPGLYDSGNRQAATATAPVATSWRQWLVAGVLLGTVGCWAYWPTLQSLIATWAREPDYSHGFLVFPLALLFLWVRRDRFPAGDLHWTWAGFVLIALSVAARIIAARYYLDSVDGWSLMAWLAGVICLFAGCRVLWWSLPSVLFLAFMVPLPFRLERGFSMPLQDAATSLSCWILQLLGQPAVAAGHTILLGARRLEVEHACAGLRMMVAVAALACAYLILARPAWWQKLLLLGSVVPIALVSNAGRIVTTALLYEYISEEAGKRFTHAVAGWAMMPCAASLFALVLWYCRRLVHDVALVEIADVLRREEALCHEETRPAANSQATAAHTPKECDLLNEAVPRLCAIPRSFPPEEQVTDSGAPCPK